MLIDTSVVRSNCDQKQKEENVWQCWIYRILHGVEVDVEDITRCRGRCREYGYYTVARRYGFYLSSGENNILRMNVAKE